MLIVYLFILFDLKKDLKIQHRFAMDMHALISTFRFIIIINLFICLFDYLFIYLSISNNMDQNQRNGFKALFQFSL
ncbi:hypothetical protein KUTeg_010180, partial [Tegillarca granosa]